MLGIAVIWLQSLVCLLMRIMTNYLRYTSYISITKDNVSHVLLLIIVCAQLLSCLYRRMAENGFAPPPPPREFCRHILSCRELKAESFKRCLHSVLRGVSL